VKHALAFVDVCTESERAIFRAFVAVHVLAQVLKLCRCPNSAAWDLQIDWA
jgi:hypothetical protein